MDPSQSFETSHQVIMFLDIHDYSILMNIMGSNHARFLQGLYERLGESIVAHQGEILKYLGDGILCLFPEGMEVEAVLCGMDLRTTFQEFVRSWQISHETELEVGISAGEVIRGIFGHESFQQKDAFGDAINVAAKIGHHQGIAVTQAVHQAIQGRFETTRLPDIAVKWRDAPIKVWEVETAV